MRARLCLPTILLLTLTPAPTPANLVCPHPVHDAGPRRSGVALRHRFVLINQGSTPLRIHHVKPGCGCLTPSLDRQLLQPREQAQVSLEVNTVTQPAGKNTWQVLVRYTIDNVDHELPLRLTADLQRDLTIEPATLVVHTSTASRHVFTLTERRPGPVTVLGTASSCPHAKVHCDRPVREGDAWRRTITLEVQASCPAGRHEGILCLHTDDAQCPELKAPFTIVKRAGDAVVCTPNAIELVATGQAALPARVVQLSSPVGTAVLVERVEPVHPCIRCTFAAGPAERSTVRVQVDRDQLPPGSFSGSVRVHLRQPPGAVVTIPVQVAR